MKITVNFTLNQTLRLKKMHKTYKDKVKSVTESWRSFSVFLALWTCVCVRENEKEAHQTSKDIKVTIPY